MSVTDRQLALLAPFIAGAQPDERDEVEMYCPLHPDTHRSASLNVTKGVWYCHAGCGGGPVERLIDSEDIWVSPEGRVTTSLARPSTPQNNHVSFRPTMEWVEKWWNALRANDERMMYLEESRGIRADIASRARIGWHETRSVYTIPIFSPERDIWNVRYYDPDPSDDRRKIWSIKGMGAPRLYPISTLIRSMPGDAIIFNEGEWDTLFALQAGTLAVTRTGAAKVWKEEWTPLFHGRRVFICQDKDRAGREGTSTIAAALIPVAQAVYNTTEALPYRWQQKHGKDLSDFLLDYGEESIWTLLQQSEEMEGT